MCEGFSIAALIAGASEAAAATEVAGTAALGVMGELGTTAAVGAGMEALGSGAVLEGIAGAGAAATGGGLLSSMSGWQMAQLGLSAGMGVMQYATQSQAQSANTAAATANLQNQLNTLATQQTQIDQQATDDMSARAKVAQFKLAQLRASAGESGVSGASENSLEREVLFNSSTDVATMESNRQAKVKQTELTRQSLVSQTQSQINSVQSPSLIGTGLQIAGTYVNQQTKTPNTLGAGVNYNTGG